MGLRGRARRLDRRARSLGDHLHRLRPGRARRSTSRRRRTSAPSSATASSSSPEDKNAALLPERDRRPAGSSSTGRRPQFGGSRGEILLSRSTDLISWSAPEQVLQPRAGAWWDSLRIGIGPPPLRTEHGWLLIYHGVKETVAGEHLPRRPRAARPRRADPRARAASRAGSSGRSRRTSGTGDVPNVVFPCGLVHDAGHRRDPPLLRRRRHLDLPRHRPARRPARRRARRAGCLTPPSTTPQLG